MKVWFILIVAVTAQANGFFWDKPEKADKALNGKLRVKRAPEPMLETKTDNDDKENDGMVETRNFNGNMWEDEAKKSRLGPMQKQYEELLQLYKRIPNMSKDEILDAYKKVSQALDDLEKITED